jgi:hypothetical protein
MVQMLVDQGVMSAEDARHAPGKNVILQAVGLGPDVRVAIGRLELRRGDRLLLCSDGVSNQITDAELRDILTKSGPRESCETMIALANERGGEDNETVIVADVIGEDLAEVDEYETVTSTFEVLQAFDPKPKNQQRRRRTPPAVEVSPPAEPEAPAIEMEADEPPPQPSEPEEPEISVVPGAASSSSMPAAQTEPEKRGWMQSLLDRLKR